MPQSTLNGHSEKLVNGHQNNRGHYENCAGSFLFTSESVGEGHPGKFISVKNFITLLLL